MKGQSIFKIIVLFLALLVMILGTIFLDTEMIAKLGVPLLVAIYVVITKCLFLGSASINAREIQGLDLPFYLAYIPYVQIVMWTKNKRDLKLYFTFLILAILSPLLMTRPVMMLFDYGTINLLFTISTILLVIFLLGWRIMHAKILSNAISSIGDFLDDKIGDRHGVSKILDIPKKLSLLFPFLSLLGVFSLVFDSSRLVSYKRSVTRDA